MIVIAGMRASADILMPFLLALFIAVICAPLYQGMRRRHVPTSLAVTAILLLMMGGVLILVGVVERAITALSGNLPAYQAAFLASTDQLWGWLEGMGLELPEATLREYLNLQVLLRYLGTIAGTLARLPEHHVHRRHRRDLHPAGKLGAARQGARACRSCRRTPGPGCSRSRPTSAATCSSRP